MANLRLEHVSFSSNGRRVLDDISFEVPPYLLTMILGPAGGGKSALLKVIGGILTPDEGNVFVDNVNLFSGTDEEIIAARQQVSFVFQIGGLISNLTLRENFLLPLGFYFPAMPLIEKESRILQAIDRFGFTPEMLLRRPAELSRPAAKQAGLIRALLTEPELVVMDDPFANCDIAAHRHVLREITGLKKRKVSQVILNESSEGFLRLADWLVICVGGRIIDSGAAADIIHSEREETQAVVQQYVSGDP